MFFIQENSNDLLDQEIIELMPMPSISKGNSNVAAILISTESIDDDDDDDGDDHDDKEEGNKSDFLDQEKIEVLSMPSTSQGNDKASAILISTENIDDDDDDDDADEDIGDDFLDQQNMEQLLMPSTSHGNSNAASMLISIENIDDEDDEEADSFTTQKLFSFAWQISKGMVGINS